MWIIRLIKRFKPVDIATILYLLITGLFIAFYYHKIECPNIHLLSRILVISTIFVIIYFFEKFPTRFFKFFRHFYPLLLLGFVYSETDALNNVFSQNLDPFFANLEFNIFHCQPSILFYQHFPNMWFIELMNFAYFSYFPLIFTLCFWLYTHHKEAFHKSIFIICSSFFMYYVVFILLPVAGPQFYFKSPDNHVPQAYIFSNIMHTINCMAEKPTAAFPSSHVGVICILWLLSFKFARNLLKYFLPVGLLLIFSTVYIKAHYVIDVFGGIISGPIFFYLNTLIYDIFFSLKTENKLIK